ncbi:hypothetical protein LG651_07310 [Tamlana sp. 62-3]|uniref:Uncharacterized protein n=1 Tax=Neotamlana sargassicola TaxID=2883125 RepID=A0A9X1I5Y9_9FLAO|nr:hypothetical protein [Tamlana sargassicola]MCB4808058.1 hypothetical protein [Tamlana sargassicola]
MAYGDLIKAICLVALIEMFEEWPIDNASDGAAPFSDKATVLAKCVTFLKGAKDALETDPMSDDFETSMQRSSFSL